MQRHSKPKLIVHWEYVTDPRADEILAQVARLILDDRQTTAREPSFDSTPALMLNEGVPVENTKTNHS